MTHLREKMIKALHIARRAALLLLSCAPLYHVADALSEGLPESVEIADNFEFIPVTSTVQEVQDRFYQNGGTISDFALVGPTTMAAPPGVDGHLFVGTQRGQVFHVAFIRDENNHPVMTSMELMLDIRDKVSAAIDRGLIGMAVHTDFKDGTGRLYLSYTHANGDLDGYYETTCFDETQGARTCTDVKKKTAGLAYYQIDDYVGDPESEELILGKIRGTPESPSCSNYSQNADCIYSDSGSHTVGGVAFDVQTGAVCLATGDGAGFYRAEPDAVRAARLDNLSGKLLCVDPDTGKGLPSNPYWTGDPNDFASRTVVYGLRNPYRFMFSPEGDAVIYMVGWNQVESAYRIAPDTGGYVGWPCHGVETGVTDYQFLDECQFEAPEPVVEAQYQYNHLPENGYQAAIVGAARFGDIYPEWLEGRYLAGDYRNDWVRILGTDENTGLWFDEFDLAQGTDPANPIELGAPVMFYNDTAGRIYMMSFLTGVVDGFNIGTIYEIVYTDPDAAVERVTVELPIIEWTQARFEFVPIEGNLTFSFDCTDSIVNEQPMANYSNIQCRWDFGDDSREVLTRGIVEHEFPAELSYQVELSLINETGQVFSQLTREVQVADHRSEASPYVFEIQTPDRQLSISESFDIEVKVLNHGIDAPFCTVLSVVDGNSGDLAREIRRCNSVPVDATETLIFPLFFSDPGKFTLAVRFYGATSDLPSADPTAYLGYQLVGSLNIQNRSGLNALQPGDDSGAGNDQLNVSGDLDGNTRTRSSGGSFSLWLLLMLSLARIALSRGK